MPAYTRPVKPARTAAPRPLAEGLLFACVVLAPFMQAFTLNVGFPLKASEALGAAAITLLVIEARPRTRPAYGRPAFLLLALTVVASAVAALFADLPVRLAPGYALGYTGDLLQYAIYALFVIAVGWAVATRLGPDRTGRAVAISIRLAAGYCLLQYLTWATGTHGLLGRFGGAVQLGQSFGTILPRNGPFLEGNYLGFYAGTALFICARRNDRLGVALAAAVLVYAQSTGAILATAGAFALMLALRPRPALVGTLLAIVATATLAVAFLPAGQTFATAQLAKMGVIDVPGGQVYDYSRDMRASTAEAGYRMGLEHPLLGVGPGRFGVWNHTITREHGELVAPVPYPHRPIANNGYAQIIAEHGIFALIAVLGLLVALAWRLRRRSAALVGLAGFTLVGLNTVPAWTMLPVWVCVGYLCATAADALSEGSPRRTRRGRVHA